MKKTKVIKDFLGKDYVQTREHFGNQTVIRNYQVEYN